MKSVTKSVPESEKTPLSSEESKWLEEDVSTVDSKLKDFIAVGRALARIRDKRLYRETHHRFEDFCRRRWQITHRYANIIISAADAAEDVFYAMSDNSTGTTVPTELSHIAPNERQARELSKVDKSERKAVWKEAVETAPKGKDGNPKITAKRVQQVIAKRKKAETDPEPVNEPPKPEPPKDDEGQSIDSPAVAEAFARRGELKDLMQQIARIKSAVLRAIDAKDSLFSRINPTRFQADCQNLYRQLKFTLPYAVCSYCGGRPKNCKPCFGTGWLSKEAHEHYVPEDLKV